MKGGLHLYSMKIHDNQLSNTWMKDLSNPLSWIVCCCTAIVPFTLNLLLKKLLLKRNVVSCLKLSIKLDNMGEDVLGDFS